MTTASPKDTVSHTYSDDEDKVVFKTPSDVSKNGSVIAGTPVGSKSASLTAPAGPGVSPSPNSMNGKNMDGEHSTPSQWNFPAKSYATNGDVDSDWVLADQVQNMKISDTAPDKNGVLAPAAEITEPQQPHSRQSSEGDSSSFDSPAIPTPGQYKSIATENNKGDYGSAMMGDGQNGYGHQYGYDSPEIGLGGPHQLNGAANGISHHHMHAGMHHSAMSPIMGPMTHGIHGPVPPFSPPLPHHMQHAPMSPESQSGFSGRPEDFGVNYGGQNRMNGRGVMGGGRNGHNGGAAFPTLNGQQNPANNPGFGYGSPPASAYNQALMSPTLTSPTFMGNGNPYSPIHAPTPYSPYATGQPQGMASAGQMYDMMAPMSPQSGASVLSGRGAQNQNRGHGYSASQPPTLRDANNQGAGGVMRSNPARQAQPRPQVPRGPQTAALNHAHSMSLPQSPYSPQLNGIPYGPMSPPPFPGYYPGLAPQLGQQQIITPELLSAMAGMAMNHPMGTAASQQAYNNSVQNALGGLQQDPSVMALIQQGGGPSANNRKLGLYKTELCRSWEEKGSCKYGEKCQFAHGDTEQRRVERHPKYKTEICRTFWVSGSCPYGKRCCFIHTELPANAAAGAGGPTPGESQGARGAPNGNNHQADRPQVDGRARSMSTNSDPNDHPSSLLARISARAQANVPASQTPRSNDSSPSNGGLPDSAIADAIARAYSAYGLPAGAASHKLDITPPEPTPTQQSQNQGSTGTFSGFSTRQTSTPSNGFGHHRVSASVDFGRQGRNLGSDLSGGITSGHMGHTRNPSASSIVPNSSYTIPGLSRTPLSGQSSPFGAAGESTSRSVAVNSSLLDHSPW